MRTTTARRPIDGVPRYRKRDKRVRETNNGTA